jgi:hypothetical protein
VSDVPDATKLEFQHAMIAIGNLNSWRHLGGISVVSVQAPEPFQLLPNRLVGEPLGSNILWSENWLHWINEDGCLIVVPLGQVCDIERDQHAV